MELSDSQKKQLELLENFEKNPYEYFSSSVQPVANEIFSKLFSTDPGKMSKQKRHEIIAELRTLKRLYQEGKDAGKDFQRYYQIRKEEQEKLK